MPLPDFAELERRADAQSCPVRVAVAGGADGTVLEAIRQATDRGWLAATLAGHREEMEGLADRHRVGLEGITLVESEAPERTAVALCRSGATQVLMKGRVSTPNLMDAILDPEFGLRATRVICQVVLMEIVRDARRFLLADTGVLNRPKLPLKVAVMRHAVELAHRLGLAVPKVAAMAASETPSDSVPESVDAAELQRRNAAGEWPDCQVQGPLSFDLAYAEEAGARKRLAGAVVGAADIMLFPDLASANLTVKAIMYTADCRFGGVLRGTTHPVVFMSRSDSTATRLRSISLALALLERPTA